MKLYIDAHQYIDTSAPLDISLTLRGDEQNVRAWYVDPPRMEAVRSEAFVGSVKEGGSVNFRNVFFNPHGHGTHTECLGHITRELHSVNEAVKQFFFKALLITVDPEERVVGGATDRVITARDIDDRLAGKQYEALIIRTLPNNEEKKQLNYSATNPPYLEEGAIGPVDAAGIRHLLIDLPSVDREEDGGKLQFHHAFWKVPENPQFDKTITELVFVDNRIADGEYILELQMAAFQNDAAPSRPVLYDIKKEG